MIKFVEKEEKIEEASKMTFPSITEWMTYKVTEEGKDRDVYFKGSWQVHHDLTGNQKTKFRMNNCKWAWGMYPEFELYSNKDDNAQILINDKEVVSVSDEGRKGVLITLRNKSIIYTNKWK